MNPGKPSDKDLQCFQKRINPGSVEQGFFFNAKFYLN